MLDCHHSYPLTVEIDLSRHVLHSLGMKQPPSKMYSWRLEIALIDALQKIKEKDGIPVSEQVRRAIKEWLKKRNGKE
jgi:hypothetical protein